MSHELDPAISLDSLNLEAFEGHLREVFGQLLNDSEFVRAKTLRSQIDIACTILRPDEGERISYKHIGRFFGRSKGTIHVHHQKCLRAPRSPHRPSILPQVALDFIRDIVKAEFERRNPVTYDYLIDIIQYRFDISIKADTLRHIVRAHAEIKTVQGRPMERQRVLADQEQIDRWYDLLDSLIEEVPGAFIFNVDETGCSDWTDSHEVRVLVPSTFEGSTIRVPRDRNSKRSTLVGCIAADGSALRPMILLSRKTMENEIKLHGYTDKHALYVHQPNAFMTMRLFEKWAHEIFFPEVEARRAEHNYNEPAILILDQLGSHHSPQFEAECEDRNIFLCYLVPHTSDQTQPLDLVTFGLLKGQYSKMSFTKLESAQSNQIVRMLGAWHQAVTPHLVISAFNAAGMYQSMINGRLYWRVNREMARRVRSWQPGDAIPTPRATGIQRERLEQ